MTNDAHEALAKQIGQIFSGCIKGNFCIHASIGTGDGKRVYRFALAPSELKIRHYRDADSKGNVLCINATTTTPTGTTIGGEVGFDGHVGRFIIVNDHGDVVRITPPVDHVLIDCELSSAA